MKTKLDVLGIIGALDQEIDQLLLLMEKYQSEERAGIVFHVGCLHSRNVVICKSGVGKVNAAICAQILVDHYAVDSIWFTGVAGAVDPRLDIGDIVISKECMQHDMDASALGFSRGTIPYEERSLFEADSDLVQMATDAGADLHPVRVFVGRILSGDQFIADTETVTALYRDFNGMCTEMEGAAVAQVCYKNHIPFIIIRSMSDRADGSANVNFNEFTQLAATQSCKIIASMIQKLK